jgi:hypothetical protein
MTNLFKKLALLLAVTTLTLGTLSTGCASASIDSNKSVPTFDSGKQLRTFADVPPTPNERNLILYRDAGLTHYNMTEDHVWLSNKDGKYGHQTGEVDDAGNFVSEWDETNGADDGVVNADYVAALNLCEQLGLKAVIRNYYADPTYFKNDSDETRWRDAPIEHVSYRIPIRDVGTTLTDLGSVDGYYMGDEPTWKGIDRMADMPTWYNTQYEHGGVNWFHINLLQSYGNYLFDGHTYEEYVDKYCEVVLSKVKGNKTLGTDYYPLKEDKYGNPYVMDGILFDYFVIAEKVKEMNATLSDKDKVLTNFCMQTYNANYTRELSSEADMNFQVNLALAFGAKSLQYYRYTSGAGETCMVARYTNDPLPLYYWVQGANKKAQALAPAILEFDWVGTKVYQGEQLKDQTTARAFNLIADRTLEKFTFIDKLTARLDTLVSEMQDKSGNKAYMVVNYSEPSLGQVDFVNMSFVGNVKKALVYIDGQSELVDVVNNKMQVKLNSGSAAFIYPIQGE